NVRMPSDSAMSRPRSRLSGGPAGVRRRIQVQDRAAGPGPQYGLSGVSRRHPIARGCREEGAPDRRCGPGNCRGQQFQAAHAQPAGVRSGVLRQERRRGSRLQADRPPVQVAGLSARRLPGRSGGHPVASTHDRHVSARAVAGGVLLLAVAREDRSVSVRQKPRGAARRCRGGHRTVAGAGGARVRVDRFEARGHALSASVTRPRRGSRSLNVISTRFRVCALLMMALPLAVPARGGEPPSPQGGGAGRTPAAAQTAFVEVAKLRLPRVSRPPQLKEFLNGTPREAEAVVTGFRQREPGDGMPVSQATAAYLSYDDRNLYVVFVCEDDGGARGHMAKREELNDDDLVGVYLDTFNDRRHAYAFEVNPLGLQRDGLMTDGQKTDYTFDTVWDTDGRLTPTGFVVWMAIPFKSLRFANDDIQTWGIALRRKILKANEDAYWPYITRRVAGFVNQMARLEDMDRVSASRNIQ